jgi:hypothetical protein
MVQHIFGSAKSMFVTSIHVLQTERVDEQEETAAVRGDLPYGYLLHD